MGLDLLIQIVGLIFAGVVKGISGFAFGLLAVGLLVTFYSPKLVIPSLLLIYFITGSILVYEHRKIITKEFLKNNPMFSLFSIIIALLGLPIGTFILNHANRMQITISLGILISIVSFYYLLQEFRNRNSSSCEFSDFRMDDGKMACYLSSFSAGVLEGFLGLGGPPLVIFMLFKRYNKFFFIASFSLFFLILSPFRLMIYLSMDFYNLETLKLSGFVFTFVMVGLLFGILIRRRFVNDQIFRKIVIIVLFLIGLNLILKQL